MTSTLEGLFLQKEQSSESLEKKNLSFRGYGKQNSKMSPRFPVPAVTYHLLITQANTKCCCKGIS